MKTKISFLLIVLAALTSCSGPVVGQISAYPAYFWGQDNGLCGFTRAVDANFQLWSESGCESQINYQKLAVLDAAAFSEIATSFDALPAPTTANCPDSAPHKFVRVAEDGSKTTWETCATNDAFFDTTGMAEPFKSLAQKFILVVEAK